MAGIGGIVRAGALAVTTGLTIADVINTETDGEAYYPSIKENKKQLSDLEPILDDLKVSYINGYNSYNGFRADVGDINAKAVVLLTKLGQVLSNAVDAQKLANEFFERKENVGRVESLPQVGGVFFEVMRIGGPIIGFGGIAWEAVSIARATNSFQAQFSSLGNHLSNTLRGTDLPTNTLRTMKVSKVEAGMMVLGLGMAATAFGLNIKNAELKRDKYAEFVQQVQRNKTDLVGYIAEVSEKQAQIQKIFDQTMAGLKDAFSTLGDKPSLGVLEAAGADLTRIKAFEDDMIPKMDGLIKGIELHKETLRLMGVADALIPGLAAGSLARSVLITTLKAIKTDIKDDEIAKLIGDSKVNSADVVKQALEKFNQS